jgi:hypothetical protein
LFKKNKETDNIYESTQYFPKLSLYVGAFVVAVEEEDLLIVADVANKGSRVVFVEALVVLIGVFVE